MSDKKIVFLDVDGTLVDYNGDLPDSAVQAVRAARANGHRVYISTGRSKAEVYPELWAIGLDGMIGGNGSYVLDSYQDYLDAREAFPHLKAGTWGGKGEHALFGDLGVANISKGYAIEKLLEHLGASRADTIAFGDAKVDIPMFEACAESCCMGSGGPEARAAAGWVTGDVDKDGLYQGFVHFGLIEG